VDAREKRGHDDREQMSAQGRFDKSLKREYAVNAFTIIDRN
jgi:hypothetical protein